MIAKKNWFKMRKFGGWGLTPSTKEGWIYVGTFVLLVSMVQVLPVIVEMKNMIVYSLVALLIIDLGTVMLILDKDEREKAHEAIAERNAAWAMVAAVLVAMGYKAIWSGVVDPIYLVIILVGALVKSLSFIYLRDK